MSWEQAMAIQVERRQLAEKFRSSPPVSCPYCGIPLEYNQRRGILFCRAGDFQTTMRPRE